MSSGMTAGWTRWAVLIAFVAVVWIARLGLEGGGTEGAARATLAAWADRVGAGDVEGAWADLTTERYRRHTDDVVFLAGQARNRDALGALQRIRLVPGSTERHAWPDRGDIVRVVAWWEGTEGSQRVVFDLVCAPDCLVDATYTATEGRLGAQRVG